MGGTNTLSFTYPLQQGWTDFSRVRATSNLFKVLRSTQWRNGEYYALPCKVKSSVPNNSAPSPSDAVFRGRELPLRHGGTLNSRRAASPLMWLVERGREVGGLCPPLVSSLKIGEETSQIVQSPVWRSKLRLTTGVT
ncbi:hypothetical protein TNCV_3341391 [Trichonephila clavipes]|nr:hypothetical protein TNCV_3341391 [Trichonephila clavipes]